MSACKRYFFIIHITITRIPTSSDLRLGISPCPVDGNKALLFRGGDAMRTYLPKIVLELFSLVVVLLLED